MADERSRRWREWRGSSKRRRVGGSEWRWWTGDAERDGGECAFTHPARRDPRQGDAEAAEAAGGEAEQEGSSEAEAQAVDQAVVVMVAAGTATRWQDDLQRVMRFDEIGSDGFHRSWIMLFPEGKYEHPEYGDLSFTHQSLAEIKRHFDQRTRHIDIALDANHDQNQATGWLEQLELRPALASGAPAGLWGLVRWTPYGMQLLKDQLYRYFSPEFGPWKDPASGRVYQNVLMGGGLTNRPFLKDMGPVQLSEISTKPWGSVNKSMLPRSAFLDQGEPDKKSTWRLPVYEGTGPKDADGCYTKRGALNINGVRAALAALGGAHTGTPMSGVPAGVKAKLEGWLKRYGGSSSRQASEAAGEGSGVEDRDMRFDEDTQSFVEDDEDNETFADGDNDADDEEGQTYADGENADGGDDGDENPAVDRSSDTHGAFDGRHAHGKFAMHSHDGDGDHSDAKLKAPKGGAKMSESPRTARALREAYSAQQLQLAEMREQLYRRDVADTLAAWDKGKFQFSEAPTASASAKSGGKALPMVALSKRFRERYAAFMLSEGAHLSTAARKSLNALVETALSAAVVDLSQRGASFDQERRRTIAGGVRGEQARTLEGGATLDLAEKRAAAGGKRLSEMSYDELLSALVEAEQQAAN